MRAAAIIRSAKAFALRRCGNRTRLAEHAADDRRQRDRLDLLLPNSRIVDELSAGNVNHRAVQMRFTRIDAGWREIDCDGTPYRSPFFSRRGRTVPIDFRIRRCPRTIPLTFRDAVGFRFDRADPLARAARYYVFGAAGVVHAKPHEVPAG